MKIATSETPEKGNRMNDEVSPRDIDQQAYARRWLEYAPPPPEQPDNEYDVFISYRSTDRPWAMALYDVLKLASWEPFLDQYELASGSPLISSLESALEASSSGVILWSSKTKDSDWCRKERDAMSSLMRKSSDFHFVFAQLDDEQLPLFARDDLYIDFRESPEGPRGVGLLRLLWGLTGKPLPPGAVALAEEVDESARRMLLEIEASVEADNAVKLVELGTSSQLGMLASPPPMLAAARALISMGKASEALEVLARAMMQFPKSVTAKQLQGLAFRRLGRHQDAIGVLSELYAEGHRDPETMGILGAAWDARYQSSNKKLHLRKARDLYLTAFKADPTSYYTGVNAASKSLFLGEPETASDIAAQVSPLVESARDGEDFWAACTLAEVLLLQQKLDAARAQYQIVIDKHPARVGDLHSTLTQAKRICASLALSETESHRVLEPFELLN